MRRLIWDIMKRPVMGSIFGGNRTMFVGYFRALDAGVNIGGLPRLYFFMCFYHVVFSQ